MFAIRTITIYKIKIIVFTRVNLQLNFNNICIHGFCNLNICASLCTKYCWHDTRSSYVIS